MTEREEPSYTIDQLAALASGGGSLLRRLSTGFASERAPRA